VGGGHHVGDQREGEEEEEGVAPGSMRDEGRWWRGEAGRAMTLAQRSQSGRVQVEQEAGVDPRAGGEQVVPAVGEVLVAAHGAAVGCWAGTCEQWVADEGVAGDQGAAAAVAGWGSHMVLSAHGHIPDHLRRACDAAEDGFPASYVRNHWRHTTWRWTLADWPGALLSVWRHESPPHYWQACCLYAPVAELCAWALAHHHHGAGCLDGTFGH
jgi:hypothetical protein